MKINSIKAIGFKNYDHFEYLAHPNFNLFVGRNGAGKTNILDLIHYLATGRSYFTGLDREVVKRGLDIIRAETQLSTSKGEEALVVKWSSSGGKQVEWNDKVLDKLSDHIGKMKAVMMAPQDAFVLQLGNTERRKWINRLLCQKNNKYAEALKIYHKILLRRNAYLKETRIDKIDDKLLKIYWDQMKEPSELIFFWRKSILEQMEEVIKGHYRDLSNDEEKVGLNYFSQLHNQRWSDLQDIKKDIIHRSTTKGIHKDKIEFTIMNGPLKTLGSQGQNKSYFLALKLSEFELLKSSKELPLLLIDDVFSKLDENRVHSLFKILNEIGEVQVFVTDTHVERMQLLLSSINREGKISMVHNGMINLLHAEEE